MIPRKAKISAIAAGSVAAAAVVGSFAGASVVAQKLLTPDAARADDSVIESVDADLITLGITADTVIPGCYGLWFDHGAGHLRVGEIVSVDEAAGVVRRRIVALDRGIPAPGPARWNSYYYWDDPSQCLGADYRAFDIMSDIGPQPAWQIGPDGADSWAILVHGRGAKREECLRAVPVLRDLGMTCLIPSYRNDPGATPSPDGRYALGLQEWRDIEAALEYALRHGARSLVVVGWSMGGAVTLQTLANSPVAGRIRAVVLDSPVVDWGDVLVHQAKLNRVPRLVRDIATFIMARRTVHRLVGSAAPIDIRATNWVSRSDELRHPILILHSVDDDVVPYGPSVELAQRRPDVIRLHVWQRARHCKEWNVDTERWERQVREFLAENTIGA